jgi:PAS domain S-box-containing protein
MLLFKNLYIPSRIILTLLIICLINTFICAYKNYTYIRMLFKKQLTEQIISEANLISCNCIGPLTQHKQDEVLEVLNKLSNTPRVTDILIFNNKKELFAAYSLHKSDASNFFQETANTIPAIKDRGLHVLQPIKNQNILLGYIYLRLDASMAEINRNLLKTIIISTLIIFCLAVTIALSQNYFLSNAIETIGVKKSIAYPKRYFFSKAGLLPNQLNVILDAVQNHEIERDNAINALRESERKFKTIVSNIPGIVYRRENDKNWTMKYISVGVEKLTGYSAHDFVNNKLRCFLDIIHPEDKDYVNSMIQKSLLLRQTFVIEYRIIDSNNSLVWVQEEGQGLFNKTTDELLYLDGVILNINERKQTEYKLAETYNKLENEIQQRMLIEKNLTSSNIALKKINNALAVSEEKFRNIFNSTNDALTLINFNNHNFIDVNEAFAKLTGYTKQEIFAKKTYDFFAMHSKEKQSEMNQKYVEIQNTPYYEIELITKTGKLVPIEMNSRIAEFHGLQALISVIRDVTDRKHAEARILHAIIEAEERERSRFSSELHDGLGPLLSTIKLYFQWMAETDDDKKRKDITQKGNQSIDEAIHSLREISNNLSPRVLNDNGIVKAIRNFIGCLNETKKLYVEFESNIESRFDRNVEITLYRITTELINNTVKYAYATKVDIILDLQATRRTLFLKYSDNGKGFDIPGTITNRKGLGLMNIIQRVNSLNGKMNMESTSDNGMQVEIELPLSEDEQYA